MSDPNPDNADNGNQDHFEASKAHARAAAAEMRDAATEAAREFRERAGGIAGEWKEKARGVQMKSRTMCASIRPRASSRPWASGL